MLVSLSFPIVATDAFPCFRCSSDTLVDIGGQDKISVKKMGNIHIGGKFDAINKRFDQIMVLVTASDAIPVSSDFILSFGMKTGQIGSGKAPSRIKTHRKDLAFFLDSGRSLTHAMVPHSRIVREMAS